VDWIHLVQDRDQPVAGYSEHSNEPLGCTQNWEFLD